ncbi:MAG: hypothetical protein AAF549_00565 [Pseudomonadota bacterium]
MISKIYKNFVQSGYNGFSEEFLAAYAIAQQDITQEENRDHQYTASGRSFHDGDSADPPIVEPS